MTGIDQLAGSERADAIGGGAGGVIAGLLLLAAQALPLFRRRSLLVVGDTQGEPFAVNPHSVDRLIRYKGSQVSGVKSVRPVLHNGREGLRIDCDATVTAAARMPEVGSELHARIKNAVEQTVGIPVADLQLKLHYAGPEPARRVS